MDSNDFAKILSNDESTAKSAYENFINKYKDVFILSSLTTNGQWTRLWIHSFEYLRSTKNLQMDYLCAIRILSRDKTYLNETINDDQFDCLLDIANIGTNNQNLSTEIQTEALKILCNLVYQSPKCQELCLKNSAVEGIVKRLRQYKDSHVDYNIKFFDMKLLFLITALAPNVRMKVRDDFHGLVYCVEALDLLIKNSKDKLLFDDDVNLINEILKVLFNITVTSVSLDDQEDDDEQHLRRLTTVLHDLLLLKTTSREKLNEYHSNIVNLLTNIPVTCYTELITPINASSCPKDQEVAFENYNMFIVRILIDFLRDKLNKVVNSTLRDYDLLPPILTVLVKCIRCDSVNRRYVRTVILPPLRDVKKRPEEGNELRNHLCKMLTYPSTQISDLVAELLFVLCKENVGRMIKYTGYGNAAGLFAKRGLLGGRHCPNQDQYSSDSEDSDTEEYKMLQHQINPVIGCYEPPRPNPLEGMSEEQKEYEAVKLVNLIDQLHRTGFVQPCKIGEDGKPVPVEHVLELAEELPEQQRDHRRKT